MIWEYARTLSRRVLKEVNTNDNSVTEALAAGIKLQLVIVASRTLKAKEDPPK